jgi:hypothetical protein
MPVRTRRRKKQQRQVTSAISDLTVSQVRKGLDIVRKMWNNTPEDFALNNAAYGERSAQQFCFDFVLGNHMKRHQKSRAT